MIQAVRVLALLLLGTGTLVAAGAAAPIAERVVDTPSPVTVISTEELEAVPVDRSLLSILKVHNEVRSEVGIRGLRWNRTLADNAQKYADILAATGQRRHSSRVGRENERENIVVGPRSGIKPIDMARIWVRERQFFRPGVYPDVCSGGWQACSHYTQMVWPTTTHVGCGYASGRYDALVCRYSPPGNRDGVAIGPIPAPKREAAGQPQRR
jgi:hypothetical protein